MTKASDNDYPSLLLTEQGSAPTTPAAGHQRAYIRTSDHKLVTVNSSGTVTPVDSGAGSVATDAIFDAKGDLAAGTGADTAAKLTVGTNTYLLNANSAQSTGLAWIAPPVVGTVTGDGSGDVTTTSTTLVDLTAASITVTTLARRVKVGFSGTAAISSAGSVSVGLSVDAADVGGTLGLVRTQGLAGTINQFETVGFVYMTAALTAASHTFKVRWAASAGTGTMKNASATVVWHMWVEECWA